MSTEATYFLGAIAVGLGATLFMDAWALLLKRVFSIPLANYCLVGRWLRYMPEGTFVHASIAAASQKRSECAVGWIAHYVIGTVYALVLVALVSGNWLARPTLLPAMLFGIGSVLVPYLQSVWKVFWKRADLKWHRYDPVSEVRTIEQFLAVVEEDEYACFYG